MSKVDALRAMREARYEQAAARGAARAATPGKVSGAVPRKNVQATTEAADPSGAQTRAVRAPGPPAEATVETLCGHRNMGGRSCTREHGHAAKSHRYS